MQLATGACTRASVLALVASLASACSLGNTIDVCRRLGGAERDLNALTEGDQLLSSRNAMGPLPGGGALVVWTSVSPDDSSVSEVRGALVTSDGKLQGTCETDSEFTYSVKGHVADDALIAAPRASDELGVIVYRRREATGQSLWLVPIATSGCPPLDGVAPTAFQMHQVGPNVDLLTPSVASLGDKTFVAVWTELTANSAKPRLMARRFRLPSVGVAPDYLPTPLSPTGDAADAVDFDAPDANGVLTSLPDGAALAFFRVDIDSYHLKLVRFAPDLSVRWGPLLLQEQTVPSGLLPDAIGINVAYELDSFLVTWLAGDPTLAPLTLGMFVDGAGQYLSAQRSPQGGPFRLGSVADSQETAAVAVGTGDGGFLAAWQESGTQSHADKSGSGLRAVGFDGSGAVRFANRACDATDFPLNLSFNGDQTQPAMTRLNDGTLLAVWQTKGGDSTDRSGTGLRAVGLSMRDLFPLK